MGIKTAFNRIVSAINALDNKLQARTDWQLVATTTDVNTLTTQGKYFLSATGNPNAPSTVPYYVKVERVNDGRIKQMAWSENNINLIYWRVFFNNIWGRWEKPINQNELNSRFNSTNVGGRNLILQSNVSLNQHGSIPLTLSSNIDFSLVRQLTIACDISYKNAKRSTKAGNKWWRAGVEVRITYTDGSTPVYFSNFQAVTTTPTNYNLRKLNRFTVPTGKVVKSIDSVKLEIWDIDADEIMVKNPKLELYHIMTDWSPAPEDHQSQIDALRAEFEELKRQFEAGVGGGSFGD